MVDIIFEIEEQLKDAFPHPQPAKKMVPGWYKKMSSHVTDFKSPIDFSSGFNLTMKTCIPIRDVITSGYIISLPHDFIARYEEPENNKNLFIYTQRPSSETYEEPLGLHPVEQVKGSPLEKMAIDDALFKLNNPWRIFTPPGYSCYFTTPYFHNNPMKIIPGIVDTDKYHEVNFPFTWSSTDENIMVKKGMPVVQIIPFRREEYNMSVRVLDIKKHRSRASKFISYLAHFYRDFAHSKKKYN